MFAWCGTAGGLEPLMTKRLTDLPLRKRLLATGVHRTTGSGHIISTNSGARRRAARRWHSLRAVTFLVAVTVLAFAVDAIARAMGWR